MEWMKLRIVYFALLVSVAIYGAIIFAVPAQAVGVAEFTRILVLAGLMPAAAGLFVRFKVLPSAVATANRQRIFGLFIMSFALVEATGVFGLVLHFLGAARQTSVGMVAVAFVLLLICYPRES